MLVIMSAKACSFSCFFFILLLLHVMNCTRYKKNPFSQVRGILLFKILVNSE
jgi:hypothetical protein